MDTVLNLGLDDQTVEVLGDTPAALHLITEGSMLRATESDDGGWGVMRLRSVARDQDEEERLLSEVIAELIALWARGWGGTSPR